MEGHQRVVRAGLDAEVAADVVGVEVLVRQRRQVGQQRRLLRCQPEAVVEEGRPVADGDGEAAHRRADGLAGVERRVVEVGVVADQLAPRHPLGRRRSSPSAGSRRSPRVVPVEHVHGREGQPVLGRRDDAGLVLAVEGVGPVGGRVRVGARLDGSPKGPSAGGDRRTAEGQTGPRQAETAEQRAPAQWSGAGGTVRRPCSGDLARHLRQRLGEGLDLGRQRTALRVEHRASTRRSRCCRSPGWPCTARWPSRPRRAAG